MDTYYTKDLRCLTVFGILNEEVEDDLEKCKDLIKFLKRRQKEMEQEENVKS